MERIERILLYSDERTLSWENFEFLEHSYLPSTTKLFLASILLTELVFIRINGRSDKSIFFSNVFRGGGEVRKVQPRKKCFPFETFRGNYESSVYTTIDFTIESSLAEKISRL